MEPTLEAATGSETVEITIAPRARRLSEEYQFAPAVRGEKGGDVQWLDGSRTSAAKSASKFPTVLSLTGEEVISRETDAQEDLKAQVG